MLLIRSAYTWCCFWFLCVGLFACLAVPSYLSVFRLHGNVNWNK